MLPLQSPALQLWVSPHQGQPPRSTHQPQLHTTEALSRTGAIKMMQSLHRCDRLTIVMLPYSSLPAYFLQECHLMRQEKTNDCYSTIASWEKHFLTPHICSGIGFYSGQRCLQGQSTVMLPQQEHDFFWKRMVGNMLHNYIQLSSKSLIHLQVRFLKENQTMECY